MTHEDIDDVKRRGEANNDWKVTQTLLRERDCECVLEDVTARFEAIYWGSDDTPGLYQNETFIGDLNRLKRLCDRLPIAAVTGRPKRDAMLFLERFGALNLFSAIITMEDGPAKPNPMPVKTALKRLGVKRAWMFGDTKDDAQAARQAGVVPLGVLAPGAANPELTTQNLLSAGCARVFNSWMDVEDYLK